MTISAKFTIRSANPLDEGGVDVEAEFESGSGITAGRLRCIYQTPEGNPEPKVGDLLYLSGSLFSVQPEAASVPKDNPTSPDDPATTTGPTTTTASTEPAPDQPGSTSAPTDVEQPPAATEGDTETATGQPQ